jgi:VCBS repeat-containing protein
LERKVPIQVGAVIAIQGNAEVTLATGQTKPLSLNDVVNIGDAISAPANSQVVIHTGTHPITVQPGQTLIIDSNSAADQIAGAKADANASDNTEQFDPNELAPTAAGQESETTDQDTSVVDAGISISQLSTLQPLSLEDSLLAANDEITQSPTAQASLLTEDDETSDTLLPTANIGENSDPRTIDLGKINVSEDISVEHAGDSSINASAQALDTQYGTLSVSDTGAWQYQLNNQLGDIQQLSAGDSLKEVITVKGNNANYQLAITINGTNDSAQISGSRSASLTEDINFKGSGKLTITDVDFGEARFNTNAEINTSFGSAQIKGDGSWEYVLDNHSSAIQSLGEGDRLIDSFAATSLDGSSEIIRITIHGTNDTPVFSGSNQSKLYIEDNQETQGKLSIDDADYGESGFIASNDLAGSFGAGSIDEKGNWSYRVDTGNSTIDALSPGQHIYDQFSVSSIDGTNQHIIVAIKGGSEPVGISSMSLEDQALANLDFDQGVLASPDLYIWQASGSNTPEVIEGFTAGIEGDKLVLSDLVIQEGADIDLDQYLQFDIGPEGTTLHITQDSANEPQDILLSGFDASLHGSSDSEIINNLINSGNLEISSLA